jgi:hypothetical protein
VGSNPTPSAIAPPVIVAAGISPRDGHDQSAIVVISPAMVVILDLLPWSDDTSKIISKPEQCEQRYWAMVKKSAR